MRKCRKNVSDAWKDEEERECIEPDIHHTPGREKGGGTECEARKEECVWIVLSETDDGEVVSKKLEWSKAVEMQIIQIDADVVA